jgi:hypothetical protein
MKTRHLLRHIQRALARVIAELTSQGIGYTGPEQTDERRISGSGNRSCLGCRRTYQPFMQGRRAADDQQHKRAERQVRARLPQSGVHSRMCRPPGRESNLIPGSCSSAEVAEPAHADQIIQFWSGTLQRGLRSDRL